MGPPAFLRPRRIAELLDVTERSVRRWLSDGTLPSCRLGGARLVARTTLEQRLGVPLDLPDEGDDEDM